LISKRPDQRKSAARHETVRLICLEALTGLFAGAPLILSESVAQMGTNIPLVVLYLLLAVAWLAATLLRHNGALRLDLISVAIAGLVLWHGVSVAVMAPHGAPRPALNMFWCWVAFGMAFFLVRGLIRTQLECRALAAVMIAVAVCLSSHAYFQYFVEMPRQQAQYRQDPEGTLRDQGLYCPPGSVTRELFEQRLFSAEPTATFALTNSLAGFLAPWLVLLWAAMVSTRRDRVGSRRFFWGAVMVAGWIGGCLLLTRSRTACLAAGLGVVLVAALCMPRKWKWGWRIPVAVIGVLVCVFLAAMLAGMVDVQMLSGAGKSLSYRFQYWSATARMIADYPWFGCGPGNFQTYYTAYMLPQASEQVADPHNFLFEVWATAGTPAMLLLVAALALFSWRVLRPDAGQATDGVHAANAARPAGLDDARTERSCWYVYLGGLCGLIIAYPIGLTVYMMPDLIVLTLGVPLAAVTVWLLHPWVVGGSLDARSAAIALLTLLVNLLAAGGIAFPGVSGSLWLLMGIALFLSSDRVRSDDGQADRPLRPATVERDARDASSRDEPSWRGRPLDWAVFLDRRATVGLLLLVLLVLAFCYMTGYAPVLTGRALLERGRELVYVARDATSPEQAQRDWRVARNHFEQAAAADPFAAEPWLNAARMYHSQRLQGADETTVTAAARRFDVVSRQAERLNRRSHTTAAEIGYMEFEAYDATGQRRYLERAREQLERSVHLFPNHAFAHARLAWMHHLEGNADAAAREAAEALRLDALTPHQERKLSQRGLFDDLAAPEQLERLKTLPPGVSAEQLMLRLRNRSGEDPDDSLARRASFGVAPAPFCSRIRENSGMAPLAICPEFSRIRLR
jgi:tetratricopeptide (TPR) repeat protein